MAGPVRVSVVVPVYNPGPHIDECVASLLGQSMAPGSYEVILVDDGSTDGTAERLDALAAEHPHVRVRHIPNSGWPGRPRNLGMDMAAGDYVYFVDNDDWLEPEALERLHAMAVRDDADVVIGKVVGHGKEVPRSLFKANRSGVDLTWSPLLWLLTPHKLFRRAFLEEHGLRFPEGRRRLEDHLFVVHAYFHARSISILADYPCYHWVLRDPLVNASARRYDPAGYFENLREVLDVVDEHTEPGPLRDRLYLRWYRGKMLGRVGGSAFLAYPRPHRRARHAEIRKLAVERFGPGVEALLPFNLRLRSHLLREGTFAAVEALAELEAGLRARVAVDAVDADAAGVVRLRLRADMATRSGPLRFRREGERVLWVPPPELAAELPADALDVTGDLARSTLALVLRHGERGHEYAVPAGGAARLAPVPGDPDAWSAVFAGEAVVDPARAAGGSPLAGGEWEIVGTLHVAGFKAAARARRPGRAAPLAFRMGSDGRLQEGVVGWRIRAERRGRALARTAALRAGHRFPPLVRLARRRRKASLAG